MNSKEYIEKVLITESVDFPAIRARMLSEFAIRLDHASDGLVTEAGEFKDALKKFKFYGREIDLTNLIEELGDSLWYIAIACDALNVTFEEVMEKNIAKLQARYKGKFNETGAIDRNLDSERKTLES